MQSPGQVVVVSPHCGSQVPLPHTHIALQSWGQVLTSSPHAASHFMSPQNVPGPQAQSCEQVNGVSPQAGWHCALPHTHGAGQSLAQVDADSPHWG